VEIPDAEAPKEIPERNPLRWAITCRNCLHWRSRCFYHVGIGLGVRSDPGRPDMPGKVADKIMSVGEGLCLKWRRLTTTEVVCDEHKPPTSERRRRRQRRRPPGRQVT